MTSSEAEPFFRKPDLQLRDFGATPPVMSFSRNVSAERSRHPAIVTAAAVGAGASGAGS
jgi:hypothetical protein